MSPHRLPFDRLLRLRQEVHRLIDVLLEQPPVEGEWIPSVDLVEREDGFVVQVDVPGIEPDQLTIELRDQALLVKGSKGRPSGEPAARRYYLMERFMGAFEIEVELPGPVDPRAAEAHLGQGVLQVRLPALVDKRHRTFRIPITEERASDE